MKRTWFLIKQKIIPIHKKLKNILEEFKIYCETFVMILIGVMTIKVSLAANAISEKQTELTEKQIILAEKQYKNEYSPKLIIKKVDENTSIIAENILYELNIDYSETAFSKLDLFLDFDDSIFDREELYQLLFRSDVIVSIFLGNGLTYFGPDINIDQFKNVLLNLNDKDKKILNREFNDLFYYSGNQYILENIGDMVANGSIQYEINVSIHILNSSKYYDIYNVLLKDVGYPRYELKENIIIIQCLNPILIQYRVDDFKDYLKEKLNNDNIYIDYNDCICIEYNDNEDFVREHYNIWDEELVQFYSDYYETFTIHENIDREGILSYMKEQLSLKKR